MPCPYIHPLLGFCEDPHCIRCRFERDPRPENYSHDAQEPFMVTYKRMCTHRWDLELKLPYFQAFEHTFSVTNVHHNVNFNGRFIYLDTEPYATEKDMAIAIYRYIQAKEDVITSIGLIPNVTYIKRDGSQHTFPFFMDYFFMIKGEGETYWSTDREDDWVAYLEGILGPHMRWMPECDYEWVYTPYQLYRDATPIVKHQGKWSIDKLGI